MREKIKPCPFCGSKRINFNRTNKNACWLSCDRCEAKTASSPVRADAIRYWNMRRKADGVAEIVCDDEIEHPN